MSDWLSIRDATLKYGISRATLYRLISQGRVSRGKRAGDARAFVSSADLKEATTIRPLAGIVRPSPSARRRLRRRG